MNVGRVLVAVFLVGACLDISFHPRKGVDSSTHLRHISSGDVFLGRGPDSPFLRIPIFFLG